MQYLLSIWLSVSNCSTSVYAERNVTKRGKQTKKYHQLKCTKSARYQKGQHTFMQPYVSSLPRADLAQYRMDASHSAKGLFNVPNGGRTMLNLSGLRWAHGERRGGCQGAGKKGDALCIKIYQLVRKIRSRRR